MSVLLVLLGCPLLLAMVQVGVGHRRTLATALNTLGMAVCLLAACDLAIQVTQHQGHWMVSETFYLDALNTFLVVLTCLVATTTALYSGPYMQVEADHGRLSPWRLRLYHAMYAVFVGMMLLALTTNNLGLLWVALEAATLSAVLMVGIYRTAASLEAAWKYFILGGVGIAQALFGIILIYLAADRLSGEGSQAMLWTHLWVLRSHLEPTIMAMAFVFTLIGFGTKVGLVPLHSWLPDAHAEGPTPISAVLSSMLLNVAFYALLRCKALADGALHNHLPEHLMLGFGLLSLVVAALRLRTQTDVKRLFSYSSIEHMGLITFAFGLSGILVHAAALLHMTLHALIKSSLFFSVGHAVQKARSQRIEDIRGLMSVSARAGWGLVVGTLAIAGLPPFGMFRSEFMILGAAVHQQLWSIPLLVFALLVALASLIARMQDMVWGPEITVQRLPYRPHRLPLFIHLGLALWLGISMPSALWSVYQQAVTVTGGD